MRAILVVPGYGTDMAALGQHYPPAMLPLVDRPFLQHVVEFLVARGVSGFDFVLGHLPEKVEHHFGDGTRWGCAFRYHLARDLNRLYDGCALIGGDGGADEPVLLAHADRLPHLAANSLPGPTDAPTATLWLHSPPATAADGPSDPTPAWTGWTVVPNHLIRDLPKRLGERELGARLEAGVRRAGGRVETVPVLLGTRSCTELLASHRAVLDRSFPNLLLTGQEADPGVWLSRNVSIHPSVGIVPPVYIGENCRIGPRVELGPMAVIGQNCVLDGGCTVENTIVMPGSYVGEELALVDSVVDRNRLVSARWGTAVTVTDDFILGSLAGGGIGSWLAGGLSRLGALAALLLAWPVLLLTALALRARRPGPVLYRQQVVRLPAADESAQWQTYTLWAFVLPGTASRTNLSDFLCRFLPQLVNVLCGQVRFVGVQPRSAQDLEQLPADRRALYLRTKAGLITEALVYYGQSPTEDELYSAEVFYAVTASASHDLKILCRYLVRLLHGGGGRGPGTV